MILAIDRLGDSSGNKPVAIGFGVVRHPDHLFCEVMCVEVEADTEVATAELVNQDKKRHTLQVVWPGLSMTKLMKPHRNVKLELA